MDVSYRKSDRLDMHPTRPTVLLRHTLPDGSFHFDWMLARDGVGPLLTFRLEQDISEGSDGFTGKHLPDHRRVYLEYEGPISGDRGRVDRVAHGTCVIMAESQDELRIRLDLGRCRGIVGGIRRTTDEFLFGFLPKCDRNNTIFE